MPAASQANPERDDGLEAAVDQAIAACGGDMRSTVRALIVANDYLENEVSELMKAVSHAYSARHGSIPIPARAAGTRGLTAVRQDRCLGAVLLYHGLMKPPVTPRRGSCPKVPTHRTCSNES